MKNVEVTVVNKLQSGQVLGARIHALNWEDALSTIDRWATTRSSRYVCLCNAHSVVTANGNSEFRKVINHADMALPDGAPVAWMLRREGFSSQQRLPGPELMGRYCELAVVRSRPIFLYGSRAKTLAELQNKLLVSFPGLQVLGAYSPPFRSLTPEEDAHIIKIINNSGAGVVFVGLGCPKQEFWMAEHRDRITAVMIGVGAAFDWYAGSMARAPSWMQNLGLEWLHRLISEPRRLWRRYVITNTLFIFGAAKQILSKILK